MNSKSALAVLGQTEGSIESDLKTISGQRHETLDRSSFTIHEIANSHLQIREYADKNGVIFAMTWKGLTHPDLKSFMGNYFSDFKQASEQAPKVHGRSPYRTLKGSQMVLQQFGHMGTLRGKVWVLDLLPPGVSADDIQ